MTSEISILKDLVIIMSFGFFSPEEAGEFKPKVIILGENNIIKDN